MEEIIKPNDYVRTYNGRIYKVTNAYVLKVTCGHTSLRYSEITKHSPNIIDLIEVGDYVNGERVIYIDNLTGSLRQYNVAGEDVEKTCGHWQEDIKSVVTHEQFNSIKYEVI